ncbi:MAG: Na+/H+ antiporter NhaA [Chitinophagaceae bacterium]|nr:Na+/H+ antiporter NhaA [Chitinophagaceae bacterium]
MLVAGIIAGIGFTMSIFITLLAFLNPDLVVSSKMAILLSSIVAALLGWLVLYLTGIKKKVEISK